MKVLMITLIILSFVRIRIAQHCEGYAIIDPKQQQSMMYYKNLKCTGQSISSSVCSLKRTLHGSKATFAVMNCPPLHKNVYCEHMVSEENGRSCQYYGDSNTSLFTQFCCCFEKKCYEFPKRIEFEQKSLHRMIINPFVALSFCFTIFVNVLTVALNRKILIHAMTVVYRICTGVKSCPYIYPDDEDLEDEVEKTDLFVPFILGLTKEVSILKIIRHIKYRTIPSKCFFDIKTKINDNICATKFRKFVKTKDHGWYEMVKKKNEEQNTKMGRSCQFTSNRCVRSERLLRQEWFNNQLVVRLSNTHIRARDRARRMIRRTLLRLIERHWS